MTAGGKFQNFFANLPVCGKKSCMETSCQKKTLNLQNKSQLFKTHFVMDFKYDVFISYSRKDYMDENKNIIPGNVISVIKDNFEKNGISYWMDEKGDMTGKKFAAVIASIISESNVFLFVCSCNSVASKWVDRELGVADEREKHIIPFACDDSYRDDKVIMYTGPHDRIDYYKNPDKEMKKLVDHILKIKATAQKEAEKKRRQEEDERKRREEEERRNAIIEEIDLLIGQFNVSSLQQADILQQLYEKNEEIGNLNKNCPICSKPSSMEASFCDRCGFQFPFLYSLDRNNTLSFDPKQLLIHRSLWNSVKKIGQIESIKNELQAENLKLKDEIEKYKESIAEKKIIESKLEANQKQIDNLRQENSTLSSSIKETKYESAQYQNVIKKLEEQLSIAEKMSLEAAKKIVTKEKRINTLTAEKQAVEEENKSNREKVEQLNEEINKLKSAIAELGIGYDAGSLVEAIAALSVFKKKKKKDVDPSASKINSEVEGFLSSIFRPEKKFDHLSGDELRILQVINKNSKHGKELSPSDSVIFDVETARLACDLKVMFDISMKDSEMTACGDIITLLKEIASRYQQSKSKKDQVPVRPAKSGMQLSVINDLLERSRKTPYWLRAGKELTENDRVNKEIDTMILSNELLAYDINISPQELRAAGSIGNLRVMIRNLSVL